jgi:hypothetical protein
MGGSVIASGWTPVDTFIVGGFALVAIALLLGHDPTGQKVRRRKGTALRLVKLNTVESAAAAQKLGRKSLDPEPRSL